MMDVLKYNRVMLSMCGFAFECSSMKCSKISSKTLWPRVLRQTKKAYHYLIVIFMFGGLMIPFGLIFVQSDFNKRIMLMAMFLYFLSTSGLTIRLNDKIGAAVKAISKLICHLDATEISSLRRNDRKGFLIRHTITTIPGLFGSVYYFMSLETKNFFASIYLNGFQRDVHFFAFVTSYWILTWTGHFYWSVQNIAKTYAQHSKKVILEILKENYRSSRIYRSRTSSQIKNQETEDFETIMISLERYFQFVRTVNRSLGMIPLAMFACLFANIIITISFLTLFSEIRFYSLFVLGVCVANQLLQVVQVILASAETTDIIEDAVVLSEKMVTAPLPATASFVLMESKRCLRDYLEVIRLQSLIPFSALSTFTLEPSIILSFVNSVVPYTVMFITTIAHINGDNNKPLNVSSNNTISFS